MGIDLRLKVAMSKNLSEYHFDGIFTIRLRLRLSLHKRTLVNMATGSDFLGLLPNRIIISIDILKKRILCIE